MVVANGEAKAGRALMARRPIVEAINARLRLFIMMG
jgi:hypothetical protein